MQSSEPQSNPDIRYLKDKSQKGFRDFLIEGQEWCGEGKVKWANVKTIELTKAVIVFDLGILAFLGAMHEEFFLFSSTFWSYIISCSFYPARIYLYMEGKY